MKAIITVGISGSGKTTFAKTWAKANNGIISNRDDLRFSLTGAADWSEYKFNKYIESLVTELQIVMATDASEVNRNIIISDTNLNPKTRNDWVDRLKHFGYEVEIKDFPITLEEAWRRDSLRPNGVGKDVLYKQWQQWLTYTGRPRYTPNTSLPKAVIFDVDGTMTHMNGRKPYEWDKVDTDTIDEHVREMFYMYKRLGYKAIILSGRDGCCYDKTYNHLVENGVSPWDEFIMREAGDMRKDTIIKEEIFWRDIAPRYNVEVVVDDRPCVIRMWQDLGIKKVIAVGNQQVEF